ncbi:MAG: DUF805 domain-containing protein [Gammaproteobacteria bacterium]|nr:DUF805 domain-containing protein [Gammaproteobacteria bacterium]
MTEAFNTSSYSPPPLPITSESDSPWSYKGRFGRLSYFAWNLVFLLTIIAVVAVGALVWSMLGFSLNHGVGWFILAGFLLFIPMIYIMIVFQIRRLHDVNRTGWWSVLPIADNIVMQVFTHLFQNISFNMVIIGIAFVINIIFTLYLMFAKGTDGANNYGEQRATPSWEKVAGWIYVALVPTAFVLGIVAAITIPAYQSYVKREQAAHGISQSSTTEPSEPSYTTEPSTNDTTAQTPPPSP